MTVEQEVATLTQLEPELKQLARNVSTTLKYAHMKRNDPRITALLTRVALDRLDVIARAIPAFQRQTRQIEDLTKEVAALKGKS